MRFHDVTARIEEGEGLTVEFKRKVSTPAKIAREMIAFANTRGGIILFGIDDDRSVVGVESEKAEMEDIAFAARHLCDPPVEHAVDIFNFDGCDVICIEIPESERKPHYLVDDGEEQKAFVRVGEKSIQASKEMIRVLRHQYGASEPVRLVYGEAERRLFRYFEKNERITVKEYARLINVSERRASRLLVRLVRAGAVAIHTHEKTDYFTQMIPG
ncbi:putative DNA binding domain-containing protein [bacterium]|nr:putative DNA binding domain-containing protein [bacterium]